MTQTETFFDDLQAAAESGGAAAVFQLLTERLRDEQKYHELFDARLMEARRAWLAAHARWQPGRSGRAGADRDGERLRRGLSRGGESVPGRGPGGEAWMYLRPTGDRQVVADAFAALPRCGELRGDHRGRVVRGGLPSARLSIRAGTLRHVQRDHAVRRSDAWPAEGRSAGGRWPVGRTSAW